MDTNEATIYIAVVIGAAVIGIILFYFAITMLRNHRRYFKIQRQIFFEEINLLEKERNRIASDLHDELGPLLSVAKIHVLSIQNLVPEDKHHLDVAISNIDYLTKRFEGIAKNLTPRLLTRKGLETTLADFLEQYEEVSLIQMSLRYRIRSFIHTDTTLQIFRIVQELVHNAVKHSGASHLSVQLGERKKMLYLFYKDNGKGIKPESRETTDGMGLTSLQRRAEMLGGKMYCNSDKEKGTEYFFELPLKKNDEPIHTDSNSGRSSHVS